jgi:hypothetical protein
MTEVVVVDNVQISTKTGPYLEHYFSLYKYDDLLKSKFFLNDTEEKEYHKNGIFSFSNERFQEFLAFLESECKIVFDESQRKLPIIGKHNKEFWESQESHWLHVTSDKCLPLRECDKCYVGFKLGDIINLTSEIDGFLYATSHKGVLGRMRDRPRWISLNAESRDIYFLEDLTKRHDSGYSSPIDIKKELIEMNLPEDLIKKVIIWYDYKEGNTFSSYMLCKNLFSMKCSYHCLIGIEMGRFKITLDNFKQFKKDCESYIVVKEEEK